MVEERPTIGGLLSRSFTVYFDGFGPFVSLALIFHSPLLLLDLVDLTPGAETIAAGAGEDLWGLLSTVWTISLFTSMLTMLATAAMVYGVFQGLRGTPIVIGRCIQVAVSRWLAVIILAILTGLATMVGLLLCVIPGLIITCGLFVASPALVVEEQSATEAMARSWSLTDGYKLTIFVLLVVLGVIQIALSSVLDLLSPRLAFGSGLASVLSYAFTAAIAAFNAVAAGVVYHDLRLFREGIGEDELVAIFD